MDLPGLYNRCCEDLERFREENGRLRKALQNIGNLTDYSDEQNNSSISQIVTEALAEGK